MATLNTLRTRGALILTIFIGVALIAFLLQDLTSASSIFYNRRNKVGSVNGNNIDYFEFAADHDNLSRIIQTLYGRTSLSAEEMDQVRDMVWESYIRKYAYEPGYRKLGIAVGEDEQFDMINGQYVSQVVLSMFSSPQTGLYDPDVVAEFISNLDYDTDGSMTTVWNHIKQEMVNGRVNSKYIHLVQNGVFVNDLEVGQGVEAANNLYDGRWVSIPFSQIPDSLVKVSSAEIKKYYKEHKNLFRQTATRDIEYVVFDLLPSDEDYAAAETLVHNLAEEFAEVESPMYFATMNSHERPDTGFYREDELTTDLAAIAFGARRGEVAGPTLTGDVYTLSRVAEEKMVPDSIGARHILLSREQASAADSIVRAIQGGKSIFDLAEIYSLDQTVDLGVFPPEYMVEPFAEAVIAARRGEVFSVDTQYGTHVVEVTYKSPMVRKVQIATIAYHIEPSAATQQAVYGQARDFLTVAGGSKENFDMAVSETGTSRRIATVSGRDRNLRGLNDSRELVRWSFNTKPGTVSQIFEVDGSYVVAVVTGAKEGGIANVRDVSVDIAQRLREEKKANLLAERLDGKTLEEAAEMDGAREGDLEGVKFSSLYIPDLGVEPAVIGALEGLTVGSTSKPVKGLAGMFLVSVSSVEKADDATEASERVRLEATAQTSIPQRVSQALSEEIDVTDNRAKFF